MVPIVPRQPQRAHHHHAACAPLGCRIAVDKRWSLMSHTDPGIGVTVPDVGGQTTCLKTCDVTRSFTTVAIIKDRHVRIIIMRPGEHSPPEAEYIFAGCSRQHRFFLQFGGGPYMLRQQLTGPCRHCSSCGPTNQTCKQRIGGRQCRIVGHPKV
jgi:hypothetical protein